MGHLLVFLLHLLWRKLAGGAPMPAPRLPGGKTLPTINPWQLAILMWVINKLWDRYGDNVKARAATVKHPTFKRVHDFWVKPDPAPAAVTPAPGTADPTPVAATEPPPRPPSMFEPVEISVAQAAHDTALDAAFMGNAQEDQTENQPGRETFLSPRKGTRTLPGGSIFVSRSASSHPDPTT